MKIPKIPDNIRIHPDVIRTIKKIALLDDNKAVSLIQRIMELANDPLPDNEECHSENIWNFYKKKLPIRRLKCIGIRDYRIFYAYRKSGMICIYHVMKRNKVTYDKNSLHYKLIKLLYAKWGDCQ